MKWMKFLIVGMVLLVAGWFLFDGIHALLTGDYVTPKNGPYAGQYGPWSKIVLAVGIDPAGNLMRWIFIIYGGTWLVCSLVFLRDAARTWRIMLMLAIGALWYVPFGTLLCIAQIVALIFFQRKILKTS